MAPCPASNLNLEMIIDNGTQAMSNPLPMNDWASCTPQNAHDRLFPPQLIRKIVAEIIATYLLVFVTCGSSALSTSKGQPISKLGASIAGGLIVTVMIYSVGHISGAHMNPAVTCAFASMRHFAWKQVISYVAAQMSGAFLASYTLRLLLNPISNTGVTVPSGSALQALVMEIVVSFALMFVTSAVATDTNAVGELAGIAVGSAVAISSILAGPISGGSMNPARTIGPAVASNEYKGIWVYLVGPILGTQLGAWSYNFIRLTDNARQTAPLSSFKGRRVPGNDLRAISDDQLGDP